MTWKQHCYSVTKKLTVLQRPSVFSVEQLNWTGAWFDIHTCPEGNCMFAYCPHMCVCVCVCVLVCRAPHLRLFLSCLALCCFLSSWAQLIPGFSISCAVNLQKNNSAGNYISISPVTSQLQHTETHNNTHSNKAESTVVRLGGFF